ncbi:MAG: hypothetical protein LBQ09_00675 [Acidobacteriaceae bacterium]|jgi:LPS-assembly protein|nr:hypothetical protein [Acidobacteriaceae bacterium]
MKIFIGLLVLIAVLMPSRAAWAQFSMNIAGYTVKAGRQEKVGDKHWVLSNTVELEREDSKLYADEVEFFEDEDRAIARGNVVFNQGKNRIAADHADFNTRTSLGTFYHATGIATIEPRRQPPRPGTAFTAPQQTGQANDVVFFGETVEKIATKKYKITNGGFSTCEQPTPRWDLTADTITLNVDHYTVLKQAVLRVKGVPMFYLPWMYYPTHEDGRATGFLLPVYGSSNLRGQTIHNAFFWAIDRSQDATIGYDWFSKTGTGTRGEYRYNFGGGNSGTIDSYILNERQQTGDTTQESQRSTTITGNMTQTLPLGFRARAYANYFSSLYTNQTLNTNAYNTVSNTRSYGVNVAGSWHSFMVSGIFDRQEIFTSPTATQVFGSSPKINLSRAEKPLFPSAPIYFTVLGEVSHLDRLATDNGVPIAGQDNSVSRFDFNPRIRVPLTRWPFFTVNSSIDWRDTYYSRSLDDQQQVVNVPLNRQYFTLTSQIVGPVFTRVWNTPDSSYAERFKHSIEPNFTVQRTTAIDNFNQIIQNDTVDFTYGSTTTYTYGINNRLYAKRRIGAISRPVEIVSIGISQSYYSDSQAGLHDPNYATSFTGSTPSNFSPVKLSLQTTPTTGINVSANAEIDSTTRELRTVSATGTYTHGTWARISTGWTKTFFIASLPGFNDPAFLNHYINFDSNVHTPDNKYGVLYTMNYDILRSSFLQQRVSAFYNAQCCGIAMEYRSSNIAAATNGSVPTDHQFFLSFTLAGIGSFSPFSGGLGGVPH